MIRVPWPQPVMISRIFLAAALMAVFFVGQASAQISATPIGPGVAGQIHALAYDPDNPQTVIAGSDVGGVFRSDDHGASWYAWSDGLQNTNLTPSMYVDDLLVINDPSIDSGYHGVWAATHGGIYFRSLAGASPWELKSTDGVGAPLSYTGRWKTTPTGSPDSGQPYPEVSKPIPFSSLAYDAERQVLYAGAGHGRWMQNNHPWRLYYPEAFDSPDPSQEQFSLWECNIGGTGSAVWLSVGATLDKGIVKQVAVSSDNAGDPIAVFSTRTGVWAYEPTYEIATDIWANGDKSLEWEGVAWGVATGSGGEFYCLRTAEYPERPGIYHCNLDTAPLANVDWDSLGNWDLDIEPYDFSMNELLDYTTGHSIEMMTLTVVPGVNGNDEVYVGHRDFTNRNGIFRYGPYSPDGVTTITGWIYAVFSGDINDSGHNWDEFVYSYTDWADTISYHYGGLDPGWCSNSSLAATTPPIVHPNDPTQFFASVFHIPVGSSTAGSITLDQKYCTGSGEGVFGSWSSNGLNLMGARSLAIDSSGRLVLGCADFGAFRSDASKSDFAWLDWYHDGSDDVYDIALVGDDVVALMTPPARGTNGVGHEYFGFARTGSEPVQSCVIAMEEPTLTTYDPVTQDGYGWRYLSRDLDAMAFGGGSFDITDIEAIEDTIIAACVRADSVVTRIFKGVISTTSVTWTPWRRIAGEAGAKCRAVEMRVLPSTTRLVVGAQGADGGVFCLDVADSNTFFEWLDVDSLTTYGERAFRNLSTIECDEFGSVVYVGSQGAFTGDSGTEAIGAVLRLDIPQDREPLTSDWQIVANAEGENSFGFAMPAAAYLDFWPDAWEAGGDVEARNRLTQVTDIEVDPRNPHHVYIGLYSNGIWGGGCFHPQVGAWELDPRISPTTWSQKFGDMASGNPPTKGVAALGIDRLDQTKLYAGTYGREFFEIDITPTITVPTIASRAEFALKDDPADAVSTTFAVQIDPWDREDPNTNVATAFARLQSLDSSQLERTEMFDDGVSGGDLIADDGVWSCTLTIDAASVPDTALVTVVARDADWNTASAEVSVDIIEPIGQMVDVSGSTDALAQPFAGDLSGAEPDSNQVVQPRIAVPLSFRKDASSTTWDDHDVLIAIQDNYLQIFTPYAMTSGVPQFRTTGNKSDDFASAVSSRVSSITVTDYDNDGYQDIFLCATNSHPVQLLRYNPNLGPPGKYEDITSTAFEGSVPSAQTAAWANYDGDLRQDLLLGRIGTDWQPAPGDSASGIPGGIAAVEPILYNRDPETGKLQYDQIGFGLGIATASYTVVWQDIDGDGDPDAFVGDFFGSGFGGNSRVVENLGWDDTAQRVLFADVTTSWLQDSPGSVIAADLEDLDGDGTFELVTASIAATQNLQIFDQTTAPSGGDNQITPSFSVMPEGQTHIPEIDMGLSGFIIADLDSNGLKDIVTLPYSSGDVPMVAMQGLAGAASAFTSVNVLDVNATGYVSAGYAHDWNGDMRPELYFGRRPVADGASKAMQRFFYRNELGGGSSSFQVRLLGGGKSDLSAIGSRVDVFAPDGYTTRVAPAMWVNGGSGRGGQKSGVLTIEPSQALSTVNIRVTWPDGGVTTFDDVAVSQSGVLVLEDTRQPAIDSSSVTETKSLAAGTFEDWTFTWNADCPLSELFVEIDVDPLGTNGVECACDYNDPIVTVYDWSPGSTKQVTRTGVSTFQHTLTIESWCCAANCDYLYRVGGSFIGTTVYSNWKTPTKIKSCLKDLPPPPPPGP